MPVYLDDTLNATPVSLQAFDKHRTVAAHQGLYRVRLGHTKTVKSGPRYAGTITQVTLGIGGTQITLDFHYHYINNFH